MEIKAKLREWHLTFWPFVTRCICWMTYGHGRQGWLDARFINCSSQTKQILKSEPEDVVIARNVLQA